jgi:hypothetical protein
MATAMIVFSRLFVWGTVAPQRDSALVEQVIVRVRAAAQGGWTILWAVDGFAAWMSGVLRVFREPLRTGGRGRPHPLVWADLHIVQVVKRYAGRRISGIERRLAFRCRYPAEALM